MNKKRNDIIITIILLIIFSGLVYFNFLSYEIFEKRTLARIERHDALEAQQQEKLAARQAAEEFIRLRELTRDQDIRGIIRFDEEYSAIKNEYIESIAGISEEMENKVVNISDMKVLADKRIDAARKFKGSLSAIEDIPGPIEDFHELLIEFLENDISTWDKTRSYYAGSYDGSSADIERLHRKNSELYRQAEDLYREIHISYGLEELL